MEPDAGNRRCGTGKIRLNIDIRLPVIAKYVFLNFIAPGAIYTFSEDVLFLKITEGRSGGDSNSSGFVVDGFTSAA